MRFAGREGLPVRVVMAGGRRRREPMESTEVEAALQMLPDVEKPVSWADVPVRVLCFASFAFLTNGCI